MTGMSVQKLFVAVVLLFAASAGYAAAQVQCPPKWGLDVYTLGTLDGNPFSSYSYRLIVEHVVNQNSLAGVGGIPCFSFNISLFEDGRQPSSDEICHEEDDFGRFGQWDRGIAAWLTENYNCDQLCFPSNSLSRGGYCSENYANTAIRSLVNQDPRMIGVLHSGCSGPAKAAARYLNYLNMPIISSSASSAALSDVNEFPNFFRTIASDTGAAYALTDLIDSLGIGAVSILTTTDAYSKDLADGVEEALQNRGIDVMSKQLLEHDREWKLDDAELDAAFQRLVADGVKAIISPSYCPMMKYIYRKAVEYGLTSDDCILWITSGSMTQAEGCGPDFPDQFMGMIGTGEGLEVGKGIPFSSLKQFWSQQDPCAYPDWVFTLRYLGHENKNHPSDFLGWKMPERIDAVLSYAIAIQRLINARRPVTGANIISELEKDDFSFEGATGTVTFGGDFDPPIGPHDRPLMNTIRAYNGSSDSWYEVGTWSVAQDDRLSITKQFALPGGSSDFSKCLRN